MPTVSEFFGIRIEMRYLPKEHNPPHIHAFYGDTKGVIDIQTLDVLKGNLNSRTIKLIKEWITEHKIKLLEMWNTQRIEKIISKEW